MLKNWTGATNKQRLKTPCGFYQFFIFYIFKLKKEVKIVQFFHFLRSTY
jgi:hypothetical protein